MIRQRFLWCLVLIALGIPAAIAQIPTFRVTEEEVLLDVLVTNKGKPVEDLKASDFEVWDNGVKQTINYAMLQKQLPINALLVFDMSRSVEGRLLKELKDAARIFLANLEKDDQAGLITFNHSVNLGSPLTHDFINVTRALNQTKPVGFSSLIDASYAGLAVSESASGNSLIIIFSDGLDTSSWLTGSDVVDSAKHKNAVVYGATTRSPNHTAGSSKQESFLDDIIKATGGSLFYIEASRDLSDAFLEILKDFRQHYLVTYTPQRVAAGGWHALEVKLKDHSLKIKTRPGYTRSSR
jgi:Ca-activated chloride channel homolog